MGRIFLLKISWVIFTWEVLFSGYFLQSHNNKLNSSPQNKPKQIVPVDPTSSRDISGSVLGGGNVTGSQGLFRSLSGSVSGVGLRLKSFSQPLRQLSSRAKKEDLSMHERINIEREQLEIEEEEKRQMAMAHEIFMRVGFFLQLKFFLGWDHFCGEED